MFFFAIRFSVFSLVEECFSLQDIYEMFAFYEQFVYELILLFRSVELLYSSLSRSFGRIKNLVLNLVLNLLYSCATKSFVCIQQSFMCPGVPHYRKDKRKMLYFLL